MSDEFTGLLFPRRTEPDDGEDHAKEIIWHMRNGYRRHHGIVEQPPEVKTQKFKAPKNE